MLCGGSTATHEFVDVRSLSSSGSFSVSVLGRELLQEWPDASVMENEDIENGYEFQTEMV
jgi:hypothetical protein